MRDAAGNMIGYQASCSFPEPIMKSRLICGLVLAALSPFGSVTLLLAQDGKAVSPLDEPSVDQCINDLRNGDVDTRIAAMRQLERYGPKAKAAVPDLISALGNKQPGIREYAIQVLGAVGSDAKDALPALRGILGENKLNDNWTRTASAHAIFNISQTIDIDVTRAFVAGSTPKSGTSLVLGYLDRYSADLTPHLIVLLDDIDPQVRKRSAEAFHTMAHAEKGKDSLLKKLGDKAKPIGPALANHLSDLDRRAATAIANALTHIDPELGQKAIPYVVKWLTQAPIKEFYEYTASAILQPVAKHAVPKLIEALDAKEPGVRTAVAATLARLAGAFDPLVKALQHESEFVRAGAAKAFALKYGEGAPAGAALADALRDSELIVRFAAADALVWTGSNKMREAVPVLVDVIRDGNEEEQTQAVQLLTRVGPPAKAAVPSLVKLLDDLRFPVRFEAALALTVIDAHERVKAVRVLIEGTQSESQYNQHQAAKSLAEIGPPAKEAVPALENLFEAKYVHTRYTAAEAVARIDPSRTESAVKVIVATMGEKKNQSSMVRTNALRSLRKIGPAAKSAIPALDAMLDDDGSFHGEVAVTAVSIAGQDAKNAIKFIREHLSKNDVDDDTYDIIESLPNVGPNAKFILPEIRLVLEKSKASYFQEHICETIAIIGPDAKELEPQIRALIAKTKHKSTIEAAEQALVAIGAKK